jgi:membrane fusion protein (multidrug efflux system)
VDGIPDKTFEGEVRFVAPAVEANSRSMTVEAVVENKDRTLSPGLFASAELVMPETKTLVLVPEEAVVKQGEVATVYVVQDGQARQRVASLGELVGGRVEVLTGLKGGEMVVTEPDKVRDGDPVDARLN